MLKASEIKKKEIINLTGCEKLGYISDFEICTTNGKIAALNVPRKTRSFGSAKDKNIRVPWECIIKFGDDIILVNLPDDV